MAFKQFYFTEETGKERKLQSCRCGLNKKNGSHPKRNYCNTNRCKCMLKYGSCQQNCKCVGRCGGLVCKKKVIVSIKKNRNGPSPGKAKHLLQTSVRKSLLPNYELPTNGYSFNFLEICVLCAIIHGFKDMSVDCWDTDKVHSMYIAIIEALLNLGIVIPLTQCSKQAIAKELHKLKKQFDEDD